MPAKTSSQLVVAEVVQVAVRRAEQPVEEARERRPLVLGERPVAALVEFAYCDALFVFVSVSSIPASFNRLLVASTIKFNTGSNISPKSCKTFPT